MSPEKRPVKKVSKRQPRRSTNRERVIPTPKTRQDRIEEVRAYFRLPASDLIELIAEEAVTAREQGDSGKPFEATLHMGIATLLGSALVRAQLQEMQPGLGLDDSSGTLPSDQ
jgi:hypothetical protein